MSERNRPQVVLRAIEPEDLDNLYQLENDRRLWNVGATNVPYSRYALRDYLIHCTNDIYADRQVRMMVDNAEGLSVGIADLMNFDPRHLRAEVGIVVKQPYRRMGYGLAALESLAAYASSVLHLHQIFAVVAMSNAPSLHLFAKAGFRSGGLLREWLSDDGEYQDACLLQKFLGKN